MRGRRSVHQAAPHQPAGNHPARAAHSSRAKHLRASRVKHRGQNTSHKSGQQRRRHASTPAGKAKQQGRTLCQRAPCVRRGHVPQHAQRANNLRGSVGSWPLRCGEVNQAVNQGGPGKAHKGTLLWGQLAARRGHRHRQPCQRQQYVCDGGVAVPVHQGLRLHAGPPRRCLALQLRLYGEKQRSKLGGVGQKPQL
ncbi:hypothetical protein ABPG75_009000 [Micractinium tetrahymenae]